MADNSRLTNLPREVKLLILSGLTPKEAVATSVLSRSWKSLWDAKGEVKIDFMSTTEDIDSLNDFVQNELTKGQPLLKFVLRCTLYKENHPIEHMLSAVTRRLLAELDISVTPDKENGIFQLPDCVLLSPYLKYLKLNGVDTRVPNGKSVFPALRRLQVDISLQSDISLQDLYVNCPSLQELTLEGFINDLPRECGKRTFAIYSSNLEILNIRIDTDFEFAHIGHNVPDPVYTFVIDAPKVQHLFLNENMLACYKVCDLTGTVKEDLQIGWKDVEYQFTYPKSLNDVFSLFKGLANVQSLSLYEQTTAAAGFILREMYQHDYITAQKAGLDMSDAESPDWKLDINTLPIFSQLTKLSIQLSHRFGSELLMYLLDRTPALKVQIIQRVERNDAAGDQMCGWMTPPITPVCLRNGSLQKVQLKGFLGHEEECIQMVNYFQDISRTRETSEPEDQFVVME